MFTEKLKEVEALREKAAKLEAAVAEELESQLKNLPFEYGFNDVEAFVAAVRQASGEVHRAGRMQGRRPAVPKPGAHRRRLAKITHETRAQVKEMVTADKTGAEIAMEVGISLPSVQNIKKALGMVATRPKIK